MPYRSEHDTVDARRRTLAAELAQVREDLAHERWERGDLAGEERRLLRAIAALGLPPKRASLPPLSKWRHLRVASPCAEDWNAMVGDERARHCSRCEQRVYDLSGLTHAEIDALLARDGERPCVRLHRRHDGTIVTRDDCVPPEGREAREALVAAAGVVAVAVATAVGAQVLVDGRLPTGEAAVPARSGAPASGPTTTWMGRLAATPEPERESVPWEREDRIAESFERLAPYFGERARHADETDEGAAEAASPERARRPRAPTRP